MIPGQMRTVFRHLRQLANGRAAGLPDALLLERFVHQRDEAAFEVLVWRHGTMVYNVCRRLLSHAHDAEDAFQATFLTLVRKAGSIGKRQAVAGWLYKVAYRIALHAQADTRRTAGRALAFDVPVAPTEEEVVWRDLRPVLDEEVNRLPEKYRLPVVLCYLEGLTNEEAARQLGCPKGTVAVRLLRARERLRQRLTRRGVVLSAGLLTSLMVGKAAALPAPLVHAALRLTGGASGVVSAQVIALTEGVLRTMLLSKLRIAAALVLAASLLAGGIGLFSHDAQAQRPGEPKVEPRAATSPQAAKPQGPGVAADELAKLEGTWVVVSHARDGVTVPRANFKGQTMTIRHPYMIFEVDGRQVASFAVHVDPSRSPKTIDTLTLHDKKMTLGIYKFEGDRLTICEAPPGEERPTDFLFSWQGSKRFLTVYRRQPAQTETEKLRGTWKLVSLESGGQTKAMNSSEMRWVIGESTIASLQRENRRQNYAFRLRPDRSPKEIDLITADPHTTSAAAAYKERPGIYAVEGDKLKICLGEQGRPTSFDTRGQDPKLVVFHFERESSDLDSPIWLDDPHMSNVAPKLWAAISISQPIFMQSELDRLQIHFCLSGLDDRTINPRVDVSKIIVNGKELPESAQIFREANVANRTYFDNLPPGVTIHTVHNLGKYFREGGVYRVNWKGENFESPEIMFRVSR